MKTKTNKKPLYLMAIMIMITLLMCNKSNAQLTVSRVAKEVTVGQIKPAGILKAELVYTVENGDTDYVIRFQNFEYKNITDFRSVRFTGTRTCKDLYTALKSFYLPENKGNKDYKLEFTLGTTDVIVTNHKYFGTTLINVYTSSDSYIELGEGWIDKLFGKNN